MQLNNYLRRNKISQSDFAKTLTAIRGWPVSLPQVNRWCHGKVLPGQAARRLIAGATSGQVGVGSWGK
jgi:DNA-binding transcriptional regulator YiaG